MLRFVEERELKPILAFLKEDVENCIYLYTDVFMYGLDNPNMKLWAYEENGEYIEIVMKYHDSFQIYARKDAKWDVEATVELIKEYDVSMVNSRVEIIEVLKPYFEDRYEDSYGTIIRLNSIKEFHQDHLVEMATLDDVDAIAELLAEDPYYSDSYTKEELVAQLHERIRTGLGRSAIIRQDGKIVAHCASMTEADKIAVSGGTITKKEYRGRKYGLIVENYMNKIMNQAGYQWFGFILEEKRVKIFEELGNKVVTKYGKLVKRK